MPDDQSPAVPIAVVATPQDDHDRLIRLEAMVAQIHKAIMGNGQPGLLQKQAEDRTEIGQVREDLKELILEKVEVTRRTAEAKATSLAFATEQKAVALALETKHDTPSKGGQRFSQYTAITALLTSILLGILQALRTP